MACRSKSLYAVLFLILVAPLNISIAQTLRVSDDIAYTHAQRLVDIGGGRRMNIYCVGHGAPTVIFNSGGSDSNLFWAYVQPEVAKRVRACSYDRAGFGFSDPSPRPSTSANAVDDLHSLLRLAGEHPPFVLVGHSFGAINIRLYANEYFSEVSGMILLDGGHEDQFLMFAMADGGISNGAGRLATFRKCASSLRSLSNGYIPGSELYNLCIDKPVMRLGPQINGALTSMEMKQSFQDAQLSEWQNGFNGVDTEQLRLTRRSYGDLPLIILTRTLNPATLPPQDQTPDLRMRWALFDELAALSTRGQLIGLSNTSHDIELDRPDAVVHAIDDIIGIGRVR